MGDLRDVDETCKVPIRFVVSCTTRRARNWIEIGFRHKVVCGERVGWNCLECYASSFLGMEILKNSETYTNGFLGITKKTDTSEWMFLPGIARAYSYGMICPPDSKCGRIRKYKDGKNIFCHIAFARLNTIPLMTLETISEETLAQLKDFVDQVMLRDPAVMKRLTDRLETTLDHARNQTKPCPSRCALGRLWEVVRDAQTEVQHAQANAVFNKAYMSQEKAAAQCECDGHGWVAHPNKKCWKNRLEVLKSLMKNSGRCTADKGQYRRHSTKEICDDQYREFDSSTGEYAKRSCHWINYYESHFGKVAPPQSPIKALQAKIQVESKSPKPAAVTGLEAIRVGIKNSEDTAVRDTPNRFAQSPTSTYSNSYGTVLHDPEDKLRARMRRLPSPVNLEFVEPESPKARSPTRDGNASPVFVDVD